MRRPSFPRLLALVLALGTAPLAAQSVRGRVVGVDGRPVAGAIVVLQDSAGTERRRLLSGALGNYLLLAPGAGRYTVQVLRIGYPAFRSDPVRLEASGSVELVLTVPEDPIELGEIVVRSGGESCSASDSIAGATATLLDEVRKAFGSADLALRDRELRFEVLRRQERSGLHVEHATDSVLQVLRSWPIHSLPVRQLVDRGFVQAADSVDPTFVPMGAEGRVWFGPDPTTLFDPAFLGSHCYRIVTRDADLVGLTFRPARGRRTPDIEGTLWLRRRTLALEKIEYEYVNIPRHLTRGSAVRPRGTMELLRLPSGLWIVSRWSLRVPVERLHNGEAVGVAGWLEDSGEIRHVRGAQGQTIY